MQAELEFVQGLANPEYLHCTPSRPGLGPSHVAYPPTTDATCALVLTDLAQHRFFDDPQFVRYIEYLQYWREIPYCLYVVFPHCLRMLELLQSGQFMAALKRADFKDHLACQQHWHWGQRYELLRQQDGDDEDGGVGAGLDDALAASDS